MASATPQPIFSVPFRHLKSTYFVEENSASDQRPNGLMRFVGDESNLILRYLAKADESSVTGDVDFAYQWPLVLFGPSGTGKTSLAMSIISNLADQIPRPDTNPRPVFMTAADFDRRYRSAMETDSVEDYRNRLSEACGIVIDDLHKLAGKTAAQNELAVILDRLAEKKRPIVITLDRSPLAIDELSVQLTSRLSGGLTLPVNPPGPTARREIIRDLALINGLPLTEDAIELMVNQLDVTVPKLVHIFAQTKIQLRIDEDQPATEINAADLSKMFKKSPRDVEELAHLIIKEVAAEFHLKPSEIKGNSRKQSIVLARGIAIYLNREMLGNSFLKVGSYFGNRDHSTVMHSYRKITNLLAGETDSETNSTVSAIKRLKQKLSEQFASQINFI